MRILGIESSCDDTGAAVLQDGRLLANVVSSQLAHQDWGGVVPELASRLHTQAISRVVQRALQDAHTSLQEVDAIAVTEGPGLMGALLVGFNFAKGLALATGKPLVGADHMTGHLLSVMLAEAAPSYPFLSLTVSGGHTRLVRVDGPLQHTELGTTLDDAAGEAFDKIAQLLGLPYPGGPALDKLAQQGDPSIHTFPQPKAPGLNFTFSGLKTSVRYYLRDRLAQDPTFLERHRADVAASVQQRITRYLLKQLFAAAEETGLRQVAIVGGVAANSALRAGLQAGCAARGLQGYIPPFQYCTDNAAMIAYTGWQRALAGHTLPLDATPYAQLAHAPR